MGSESWFVVLPDLVGAGRALRRLRGGAVLVAHRSGRPWVVGSGTPVSREDGVVVIGGGGGAEVAVRLGAGVLAVPVDGAAGGDRVRAGSCHLSASVDGGVRVRGTASGLRRVFHARVDGVDLACDRADVLAAAASAPVDEAVLAALLLGDRLPHPLTDLTPWRGVTAVPAGSELELRSDGGTRTRRWWTPPEPVLGIEDGAAGLRRALEEAVGLRGDAVTAGPGGIGAAVLGLLADRRGALTPTDAAPGGAATRATDLPAPPPCAPPPCAPPGPLPRLHGTGADEVVGAPVEYLHDLARHDPRAAWQHLAAHRARHRWAVGDVLRGFADRRDYRAWLLDQAHALHDDAVPPLGWGAPPRLPPWVSVEAAAGVAALLRAHADVEPLAPRRGQHSHLQRVRAVAASFLAAGGGEAPFLDDRVLEACLAVRAEQRGAPWGRAPLLVAAVPEVAFAPEEASADHTGENENDDGNHDDENDVLDASPLTALGIVDADVVRAHLAVPEPRWATALAHTLAVARWRPGGALGGGPPRPRDPPPAVN
ncbi:MULTISPECIES: asparagine synthase-related protein [Actinosynnema]|uniref:asparagine synthase-related protein n=1 Tax=Actinosynnema TaxID=40566 RepID=UPI0020A3CD87|nr:asparagine synthase-related protein [Actinosynnema pretiosum]MCP2095067.1 asparagine synthase (glutamine-hydrolyzing) [Actinosynnema pretiosum]